MAYKEETISKIVKGLNDNHFLPAIQREYVWSQEQICTLFDSILRGYPISSFLFWELEAANRDKWEVYKFIDHFKEGGTHNELANAAGVANLTLVLDGQQRLTSLLIGLKGNYSHKKRYGRKSDPDAWIRESLYLDLFKDPKSEEDDAETGIRYRFQFRTNGNNEDGGHYWFKVCAVLDFDSEDKFYDSKGKLKEGLPGETTKKQIDILDKNLDRLYRAIWKDNVISFFVEREQDYDRVLDIFVRANVGGTKLSKSDLLLSMMTNKWGDVNAREAIYGFVDHLNAKLKQKNDLDKDIVMKSCLVLCDLPVKYKVENFNNQNLALIRQKWTAIKSALTDAVVVTNSFGIDRETLTAANALIPVAYYFLLHPEVNLMGTAHFDQANRDALRRWLLSVLLNGTFGGQSDNLLTDLRTVIQTGKASKDFPVATLNAQISKSGRKAGFDEDAVEHFLETSYGKRNTFLALSLLYDECSWGNLAFDQDHIFPKSMFYTKSLLEAGIDEKLHDEYREMANSVANLQLLLANENKEKSDQEFIRWITTRAVDFKTKHLIPDDANLYTIQNFPKFIDAREALIRTRLKGIFATPAATATGEQANA